MKLIDDLLRNNGILFSKLFWPIVRKKCSRDREKLLKLEAKGWEFAKILRPLAEFIRAVKGQYNFWNRMFLTCSADVIDIE